jgi:hypothetical protein
MAYKEQYHHSVRWVDYGFKIFREFVKHLSLTFEIVYGHGFKRFAAPSSGELTAISLEDMRHMVRRSHRSQ